MYQKRSSTCNETVILLSIVNRKNVYCTRLALTLSVCLSLASLRAQTAGDFSGVWQQNLTRSVPLSKAKRVRKLSIQQSGSTLTVQITNRTAQGVRTLDLKYEIGGPELVYKGLDGDEFHTKVTRDGDSLVFDTVEHERGKEILSKQIWTLSQDGRILREVRQRKGQGEAAESVVIFEKEASLGESSRTR
jgi:hypothetical protein